MPGPGPGSPAMHVGIAATARGSSAEPVLAKVLLHRHAGGSGQRGPTRKSSARPMGLRAGSPAGPNNGKRSRPRRRILHPRFLGHAAAPAPRCRHSQPHGAGTVSPTAPAQSSPALPLPAASRQHRLSCPRQLLAARPAHADAAGLCWRQHTARRHALVLPHGRHQAPLCWVTPPAGTSPPPQVPGGGPLGSPHGQILPRQTPSTRRPCGKARRSTGSGCAWPQLLEGLGSL